MVYFIYTRVFRNVTFAGMCYYFVPLPQSSPMFRIPHNSTMFICDETAGDHYIIAHSVQSTVPVRRVQRVLQRELHFVAHCLLLGLPGRSTAGQQFAP